MTNRGSSLKVRFLGILIGEASGTLAILVLATLLVFFGLLLACAKGWV